MVVILCRKGSKQIWKQRPTGVAVLEAECVTFRVKRGGGACGAGGGVDS